MEQRLEKHRRVGEPSILPGRIRGGRRGELHRIPHPRPDEFELRFLLLDSIAEVGAAGPPHEPIVGLPGPRSQRHAQPLQTDRVDLRLQVAVRIDDDDPLSGRIVQHDLVARRGIVFRVGRHRPFQKVPGQSVAEQRQTLGDGFLLVVGEDLALDPQAGLLFAVCQPGGQQDREGTDQRLAEK